MSVRTALESGSFFFRGGVPATCVSRRAADRVDPSCVADHRFSHFSDLLVRTSELSSPCAGRKDGPSLSITLSHRLDAATEAQLRKFVSSDVTT